MIEDRYMTIQVDLIRFRIKVIKHIEIYRGLYDPLVLRKRVKNTDNVFDIDDSEWRKAYQVPDFILQVFRSNDPEQQNTLLVECTEYKPRELVQFLDENF
jgi:hypothetical protein